MAYTVQSSDTLEMNRRHRDPLLDRRSGDDRRTIYSLVYFSKNTIDRRFLKERRRQTERRRGYVRISDWSSMGINK